MKRVKLISPDPEINGKEAFCRVPAGGCYFINGIKTVIHGGSLHSVQEKQPHIWEVTLINFNELPDEFPINVLTERVKYDMYDQTRQPHDSTIERRLRELRERGLINYEVVDHVKCIYKKKPLIKQLHRAYSGVTTAEIPVFGEISKTR